MPPALSPAQRKGYKLFIPVELQQGHLAAGVPSAGRPACGTPGTRLRVLLGGSYRMYLNRVSAQQELRTEIINKINPKAVG